MREEPARSDVAVARLASRQHGVVSIAQLEAAGLDKSAVTRRLGRGHLHRIHRGVYAVGHRGLSNEGRWMAAVLACGNDAVLSHGSAAELWALLPVRARLVEVTIRSSNGRARRAGIRLHRSLSLHQVATTRHNGIDVTAPARTLADLRRTAPAWVVRKATRQAEFIGLEIGEIRTDGTRSDLERDFLGLCRRHGLAAPEVNVKLGPFTVDFFWRTRGLVVETDGWAAHRGHQAFEDDRERELRLRALGYRVLRFSDVQVESAQAAVAGAVRAELG